MGGTLYYKHEITWIKKKFATATIAEIMACLPGRNWTAVAHFATFKLGLKRTRGAKAREIDMGKFKADTTRGAEQ